MADYANIKGLKELKAAMLQLPKEIQGKVLGTAVQKEAAKIRDKARSASPASKTGLLKKAIVAYRNKTSTQERIIYDVGVTLKMKLVGETITAGRKKIHALRMGGAGKPRDAFYWRFIEFGTKKMTAKPFLRPAFDENKSAAVEGIKMNLATAIEKAAARLGRK